MSSIGMCLTVIIIVVIFFSLLEVYKIIHLKIEGILDLKIYGNLPALPSYGHLVTREPLLLSLSLKPQGLYLTINFLSFFSRSEVSLVQNDLNDSTSYIKILIL